MCHTSVSLTRIPSSQNTSVLTPAIKKRVGIYFKFVNTITEVELGRILPFKTVVPIRMSNASSSHSFWDSESCMCHVHIKLITHSNNISKR